MEFLQNKKYNVGKHELDILNLKPYDEIKNYPCHFCHDKMDCWSYTDGKESIHLCPSCSLELSERIYFEKSLNESVLTPSFYDENEDEKDL